VIAVATVGELEEALRVARDASSTTVVHVETDPLAPAPSSEAWWDVPVAEVSGLESTRAAREGYDRDKRAQRLYLSTREEARTR